MNLSSKTAILAVVLLATAVPAIAADISVSEYRQQVRYYSSRIEALSEHPEHAGGLAKDIPESLTVNTPRGPSAVSLKPLKDAVATFSASSDAEKPAKLEQIKKYMAALSREAESYDRPADFTDGRQKLNAILQRREFNNVRPPGIREALLDRIYRWIWRLLRNLRFGGKASFNVVETIVYVLIGLALLIAVMWTIRRLRRPDEELPEREIIPFAPSARNWRAWLSDARAFAARNDWRNAIHMAYWAGISFLEAGGAWKPNRARTPREYLRLINPRDPQLPALSTLTGKFEVVWYGQRPAEQADYEETLGHLEKLGCR
ncbi:MAG TPA: DUF4129 domain-containing protein [Candidatus Limnocylindrales bacterium]|jgi:hypothetical protein|nr:DUF4129 domain-containing protein [Candidatus Limnocylindrales bacterium]